MGKSGFERVLMAQLLRGEGSERFELPAAGKVAVGRALQKDLGGPSRLASVQAALRLAAAFDGSLRSPSVAGAIRELLRAEPEAVRLIRASRKQAAPSSVTETRKFLRAEGREAHVRAPTLEQRVPVNALPLRALIDPGRTRLAPGSAPKRSLRG